VFEINGLAANISYFKCLNLFKDLRKLVLACFINLALHQEEMWD